MTNICAFKMHEKPIAVDMDEVAAIEEFLWTSEYEDSLGIAQYTFVALKFKDPRRMDVWVSNQYNEVLKAWKGQQ